MLLQRLAKGVLKGSTVNNISRAQLPGPSKPNSLIAMLQKHNAPAKASLPTVPTECAYVYLEGRVWPVEPEEELGQPVTIDGFEVSDFLASKDMNECVDALIARFTAEKKGDDVVHDKKIPVVQEQK